MGDKMKKPERPSKSSTDGEMVKISFRVDKDTAATLKRLEESDGSPDIRGRRSNVLRKLINDAGKAL